MIAKIAVELMRPATGRVAVWVTRFFFASGGLRADEDLQRFTGIHGAVAFRNVVEPDGAVEDLARLDLSVEYIRHQLFDVRAHRGRSTGERDVRSEERPETDWSFFVLGYSDSADDAARSDNSERLLVGRHVAYRFEDDVSAVAAGQFADLLDALVTTFSNYIGGSEIDTEVRTGLVAPHQDDALGTRGVWRRALPSTPLLHRR